MEFASSKPKWMDSMYVSLREQNNAPIIALLNLHAQKQTKATVMGNSSLILISRL